MKNIYLILLLFTGLLACNDDHDFIKADLPENAFRFKEIPGGAVMYYKLPDDPNIVGIRVRYKDARGEEMLRSGSSNCDSLMLIGFNEEMKDVAAKVSYHFQNNQESQSFDVRFSTADSGPVAFMKSLKCHSNWDGFALQFNNPVGTSGLAHVYYLGKDPKTQLPDTVFIKSFTLSPTEEEETLSFEFKQEIDTTTIIVKVEDFRGYMVKKQAFKGIKKLVKQQLHKEDFSFYCDNALEDEGCEIGVRYLFDGDTKGVKCFENGNYCSFAAGPDAAGEDAHPMYLDLKQNRVLSSIRLYNLLRNGSFMYWDAPGLLHNVLLNGFNENFIPCEVTIYGLPDQGNTPSGYSDIHQLDGWQKLGMFKQERESPLADRWCPNVYSSAFWTARYPTLASLEAASPEYLEIVVPAIGQNEGYRYIKMMINEVFDIASDEGWYQDDNYDNYVQFHELEIYSAK